MNSQVVIYLNASMDSLSTLSDEVLLEILRNLKVLELARIGCTNKRLKIISEDNKLWEPHQPDTSQNTRVQEYDDTIYSEFKSATLKHRVRLWKPWQRYSSKLTDINAQEFGRNVFRTFSFLNAPFYGLFTIIPHILSGFIISPLYKAKLLALIDSPMGSSVPIFTLWNVIKEEGISGLFDGWYMYGVSTLLAMIMPIHGLHMMRYAREVIFLLILSSVDRIQARVPFFSISILHYLLATVVFLIQRRLYLAFFRRLRLFLGESIFSVSALVFIWFDAVVIRCVTATPQDTLFSTLYASVASLFTLKLWTAAIYSYPMRLFTGVRMKLVEWFGSLEHKLQRLQARREFLKQVGHAKTD